MSLLNKILIFISTMLFSISLVWAEDGTNSSGGANDLQSNFENVRKDLFVILKNEKGLFSLLQKTILMNDVTDCLFVFNFDLPNGMTTKIQTERASGAPVFVHFGAVKEKSVAISYSEIIRIVVTGLAQHFSSDSEQKEIEAKFKQLILETYPVPELLDLVFQSYQADENGCRDRLLLTSDPASGVIDLKSSSSDSCISSSWPEAQSSQANQQVINNPENKYLCSKINENNQIVCKAFSLSSDLRRCAIDLSSKDSQWPTLIINKDQSLEVNYFWCDAFNESHFTHAIKVKYKPTLIKVK